MGEQIAGYHFPDWSGQEIKKPRASGSIPQRRLPPKAEELIPHAAAPCEISIWNGMCGISGTLQPPATNSWIHRPGTGAWPFSFGSMRNWETSRTWLSGDRQHRELGNNGAGQYCCIACSPGCQEVGSHNTEYRYCISSANLD